MGALGYIADDLLSVYHTPIEEGEVQPLHEWMAENADELCEMFIEHMRENPAQHLESMKKLNVVKVASDIQFDAHNKQPLAGHVPLDAREKMKQIMRIKLDVCEVKELVKKAVEETLSVEEGNLLLLNCGLFRDEIKEMRGAMAVATESVLLQVDARQVCFIVDALGYAQQRQTVMSRTLGGLVAALERALARLLSDNSGLIEQLLNEAYASAFECLGMDAGPMTLLQRLQGILINYNEQGPVKMRLETMLSRLQEAYEEHMSSHHYFH